MQTVRHGKTVCHIFWLLLSCVSVLNELERYAIGATHLDEACSVPVAAAHRLRFRNREPTGFGHTGKCRIHVLDIDTDMDGAHITGSRLEHLAGGGCLILEQFDLMAIAFDHRK